MKCLHAFGINRHKCKSDFSCSCQYIYQAKLEYCHLTCTGHVRVRQDCLGAFYGHKLVGSPYLMKCILSFQLRVYCTLTDPNPSKNSAGPCKGSDKALECTYWLYKPGQTWVCAIYPVQAIHGPRKAAYGLQRAQNRRKLCMLSFQPRLYCALTDPKVFEKSCGPARHALRLPTGSHGLGPLTVRELHVTQALIKWRMLWSHVLYRLQSYSHFGHSISETYTSICRYRVGPCGCRMKYSYDQSCWPYRGHAGPMRGPNEAHRIQPDHRARTIPTRLSTDLVRATNIGSPYINVV